MNLIDAMLIENKHRTLLEMKISELVQNFYPEGGRDETVRSKLEKTIKRLYHHADRDFKKFYDVAKRMLEAEFGGEVNSNPKWEEEFKKFQEWLLHNKEYDVPNLVPNKLVELLNKDTEIFKQNKNTQSKLTDDHKQLIKKYTKKILKYKRDYKGKSGPSAALEIVMDSVENQNRDDYGLINLFGSELAKAVQLPWVERTERKTKYKRALDALKEGVEMNYKFAASEDSKTNRAISNVIKSRNLLDGDILSESDWVRILGLYNFKVAAAANILEVKQLPPEVVIAEKKNKNKKDKDKIEIDNKKSKEKKMDKKIEESIFKFTPQRTGKITRSLTRLIESSSTFIDNNNMSGNKWSELLGEENFNLAKATKVLIESKN